MKNQVIQPEGAFRFSVPLSHAVKAGNFIYTCGQCPVDIKTGEPIKGTIEEKARVTMENMKVVLEAAGASFDDVVKVMGFVTDLANVKIFNKIYSQYFKNGFPARSFVEVSRLADGVEFEVEAIAYIDKSTKK